MVDGAWIGLPVATGVGLLVGIERERRKGTGPRREAAGLRTFTLVCVAGALAQLVGAGVLVAVGALAIATLAAIAYWRSTQDTDPQRDPGLTTEVALLVIYLVGVQCAVEPVVGAGCGALLAALLAARERLHRFATEALSELELRDALVLAAVALVIVPLAPATPMLGGLAPRTVAWLVLAILGLQALAHVAGRVLRPDRAALLSGLLGGFVSSTATIATLGAEARRLDAPAARRQAGAAALSGAATWLQALVIAGIVSPGLLGGLVPAVITGTTSLLVAGWWWGRGGAARSDPPAAAPMRRPLRLREALWIAALLMAVSALVGALQAGFGDKGLMAGTALSAVADAHAAIASAFALQARGLIGHTEAVNALGVAIGVNTLSRSMVAWIAGGFDFGIRVALALVGSTALAMLVVTLAR